MVTRQKCSLLFSPAIAYAVTQSCEKFFAHIAMDVLPRNCFIVGAYCDSFLFFFPHRSHSPYEKYVHLSSRKCLSISPDAVLHEVFYYFSIPLHPYQVTLFLIAKASAVYCNKLQSPISVVVGDFSSPKSLLMNLRPSLIF